MSESKRQRIIVHILFWMLYFLYETLNTSWGERDYFDFSQIHKVWANIPLLIGVVYLNLYVLMPRYLAPKRYGPYVIALLGVVVAYALVARFVGYQFWLAWDKENAYDAYAREPKNFLVPIRLARNAFRLYPILALTMLIKVLRNSYSKEKQLRVAESARHQAELSFLRAQIHPHFFFNTLSTLYSLTLKQSDAAPDMVLRLSGLMRYMLYQTDSGLALLEEEVTQLKNYIAIEEMRFADRLEYSFQSSGAIAGKRISPLLLLPFVENAFKHSLSHELHQAWVTIDIKVTGHQLFFTVENSLSRWEAPASHQGIGLANVKKRLALSYPGSHELMVKQEDDIFRVHLTLQLHEKD